MVAVPAFPRRTLFQGALALGLAVSLGGTARAATPSAGPIGHLVHGTGPEPVVVMHEWLGDHTNYEPVLPYLDGQRYTYVIMDLRGYGLSKEMAGEFTAIEAARDALALMDAKGFQRFHVVGHSMSGMIAQRLALEAPDRVKSVVAITPVPPSGFKADEATFSKLAAVITDDEAAKGAIAARTAKRYGDGWARRKLAIARNAATPETMMGYLKMFTGTDFAAEVQGLKVPVRAITGENDIPFYREDAVREATGRLYPNFDLVTIRDAGHYPMLETPVLLAARIEEFIARNA